MMKKGFTLVELLAVIVILAVISIITVPMIGNVIEDSRSKAALISTNGYIQAIENKLIIQLKQDGEYSLSDIDISISGEKAKQGYIKLEENEIVEAKFCFGKVSTEYDGKEATISNNNYCSEDYEITLITNETEESKKIGFSKETEFTLSDISNMTNVSCNNGAIPKVENNTLKITNIYGDTKCVLNETLKETIDNLDETETNIVMLNDETIESTLTIREGKTVILDLNGKNITTTGIDTTEASFTRKYEILSIYGTIIINDTQNSGGLYTGISSRTIGMYGDNAHVIINNGTFEGRNAIYNTNLGILEINGGNFKSNYYNVIVNESLGIIIINNGKFISDRVNNTVINNALGKTIINNGYFYNIGKIITMNSGITDINGGIFISQNDNAIYGNGSGQINITQTNTPIYITTLSQVWKPAIRNNLTGTINIKGNEANQCTNDYTRTTSGLCVYTEGDKNYSTNTANTAISNAGEGVININGGTYYGGNNAIQNHYGGTINIINGNISSNYLTIINSRTGNTNICNATITTYYVDLWASSFTTTGIINYSSNVIFTNGTNTPLIGGVTSNIIPNYTGTCTE